jgi:hypothetical protein
MKKLTIILLFLCFLIPFNSYAKTNVKVISKPVIHKVLIKKVVKKPVKIVKKTVKKVIKPIVKPVVKILPRPVVKIPDIIPVVIPTLIITAPVIQIKHRTQIFDNTGKILCDSDKYMKGWYGNTPAYPIQIVINKQQALTVNVIDNSTNTPLTYDYILNKTSQTLINSSYTYYFSNYGWGQLLEIIVSDKDSNKLYDCKVDVSVI